MSTISLEEGRGFRGKRKLDPEAGSRDGRGRIPQKGVPEKNAPMERDGGHLGGQWETRYKPR